MPVRHQRWSALLQNVKWVVAASDVLSVCAADISQQEKKQVGPYFTLWPAVPGADWPSDAVSVCAM